MSSAPEVRAELFPTIKKELLSHERGELSELYPELHEHSATRALAEEHDREAHELEALISSLEKESYTSPQWKRTFDRLVELIEHHVEDEESRHFPKAQDAIGEKRAEELNERYLRKKLEVMQSL